MFKSKDGKVFHNPAIGRQHERDAAAGKSAAKPEGEGEGDHGAAHKVEIHHPDGPENPSPGQHHTVTHHADGSEEHADHASHEEAMDHASAQLGGDGDHDIDPKHPGEGEVGAEGEAETCPECGHEMEGGECPNCGYKDEGEDGDMAGAGHEEY